MQNPGNGIYETHSNHGHGKWAENRRVYIQGNSVKLVNYEWPAGSGKSQDVFNFDYFFEVNTLGPRVSDLPENFNIHTKE